MLIEHFEGKLMNKNTVLIIDDDEAVLTLLKIKLAEVYEVLVTSQPDMALNLAVSTKPDLILCDIDMQHLDGGDLSLIFHECDETKNIPFVFISSLVSPKEVVDLKGRVGGRRAIAKATPAKEMISMLGKILNN
jgi:PleD family two-component response regulator